MECLYRQMKFRATIYINTGVYVEVLAPRGHGVRTDGCNELLASTLQ